MMRNPAGEVRGEAGSVASAGAGRQREVRQPGMLVRARPGPYCRSGRPTTASTAPWRRMPRSSCPRESTTSACSTSRAARGGGAGAGVGGRATDESRPMDFAALAPAQFRREGNRLRPEMAGGVHVDVPCRRGRDARHLHERRALRPIVPADREDSLHAEPGAGPGADAVAGASGKSAAVVAVRRFAIVLAPQGRPSSARWTALSLRRAGAPSPPRRCAASPAPPGPSARGSRSPAARPRNPAARGRHR